MAKEYYIAEQDETATGDPSLWVVSRDENEEYIFVKRDNFWTLMYTSIVKLNVDDYNAVRKLIEGR